MNREQPSVPPAAVAVPRPALSPTVRSTVRRNAERAVLDRARLDEVLDAGLVCHLGLLIDGAPVVLPTTYGRDGDTVYLHGSTGARSLISASAGAPACLAVTLLDGVVYARSVFHHSMNYRSAVVHGILRPILDGPGRLHALRVITEHAAPGSWGHARLPSAKELAATSVLALDLAEASVKVRTGGPVDDEDDVAAGSAWAGVLPLVTNWGSPEPAVDLAEGVPLPEHVVRRRWWRSISSGPGGAPAGRSRGRSR